jgi:hypothetical protein
MRPGPLFQARDRSGTEGTSALVSRNFPARKAAHGGAASQRQVASCPQWPRGQFFFPSQSRKALWKIRSAHNGKRHFPTGDRRNWTRMPVAVANLKGVYNETCHRDRTGTGWQTPTEGQKGIDNRAATAAGTWTVNLKLPGSKEGLSDASS